MIASFCSFPRISPDNIETRTMIPSNLLFSVTAIGNFDSAATPIKSFNGVSYVVNGNHALIHPPPIYFLCMH